MKSWILTILAVLVWFAVAAQNTLNYTDGNELKQGWWKKTYPNGRTLYEGRFENNKPVGEWRRYHENGKLKALLVHSEKSDSTWAKLYDTDGKLTAEGLYIDEKKNGMWIYFSEGRKISEDNYADGSKEGMSRTFYATGEVLEEIPWKDHKRNGKYRALYTNGKPFFECFYKDDKRNGVCISYFEDGKIKLDAFYQNNLPEREWKFYNETGELLYTLQYANGLLQNPEILDEMETRRLKEMERQGKTIEDPAEYFDNPSQILLKNKQ